MIQTERALKKLFKIDAQLAPYKRDLAIHIDRYNLAYSDLTQDRTLVDVGNDYKYFGFQKTANGYVFREWLPNADKVWIYGDFNGWDKISHPLEKKDNGVWEIVFDGKDSLRHGQHVKLIVEKDGLAFERLPAYIRRTDFDENSKTLCGQIWMGEKFKWTDKAWYKKQKPQTPFIYEAHIGMAQEYEGIGSYREFADKNLDWIAQTGYNVVQLMAVQEHPYYASFGYQVTNFFAPSHRYGTPEDLKYLINKAHSLGLSVLLDVVHSHACPNVGEGLNLQDGTADQYFLAGERGWHSAWGTKCFDYGKRAVLRFLLSNLKYWQDEFHFDGFRFDGVTSMLYENHGLGVAFTDYSQYYSLNTNVNAKVYLMLANELVHKVNKNAITVAEDMSGMPGACLPLSSAGMGFDYRLAMGVPDTWIKLIKEVRAEEWDVYKLWYELTCGRVNEKTIGYCESHDQAMVGDKTIIFRLADAEMYTGMNKDYHTPTMDYAIDMHKVIRFLTLSLSRDGYLNFMGNEFGHPEWIDFPREGNEWSYKYARRQWSLVNNGLLKYEWLYNFDRDMIAFVRYNELLTKKANCIWIDGQKKIIIYERGEFLFVFNLHPSRSQESVFVNCGGTGAGGYKVIFSSDERKYGGQDRADEEYLYYAKEEEYGYGFNLYVPCRTALVLKKEIK